MSATNILREWGQAMRGDWSEVDGRSVRDEMNAFADWIDRPDTYPGDAAARERMDVCPFGFGHWTHFCDDLDHRTHPSNTSRRTDS